MSSRSIHVFASDVLPLPGYPQSAGGVRRAQIVAALRQAGHHVTCSFDLTTYLARTAAPAIAESLSADELWCCEHFAEPDVVLNRMQPEIAIHGNVNRFSPLARSASEVVHVVDLNGAIQLEGLALAARGDARGRSETPSIELISRQLIERLRSADYILTASDRQKYFWLAYCSLAGFSFDEVRVLVCPFRMEPLPVERNPAAAPAIIHAGSFYPWQKPEVFLRTAAGLLDNHAGAKLHIVGGPHENLHNAGEVRRLLAELASHPSVECHPFLPLDQLVSLCSTSWAALDLMEWSVERELAIPGRTLQYLACATPVIHSDYSSLASSIREYRAGWTVPADPAALTSVLDELLIGGLPLAQSLSANAQRLFEERLSPKNAMEELVRLCDAPGKRQRVNPNRNVPGAPPPPRSLYGKCSA